MTASPLFESRLPVGSSANRIDGEPATTRATATRCCCPPESWLGWTIGYIKALPIEITTILSHNKIVDDTELKLYIFQPQGKQHARSRQLALVTELDSPVDDMRPMIRFDGREIFLASSRTVSFGRRDLWSSVRETVFDIWSPPMNLGATINTSANELTPYLSGDGLSLYFGSDRIVAGQSGLVDLCVTHRERRGRLDE